MDNNGLSSKILFEKVANIKGIYYFEQDIVFNSIDLLVSQYQKNNQELFLKGVKDFLIKGIKLDNFEYVKYENNKSNSNRTCFITSQTDVRNYTFSGDRWFRTTIRVFASANPVRNNLGQIISWSWIQGWGHNITNFKKSWTGLYWVNGNGPLYIKTEAYVTGNPNFQWMWQTCTNCSEIDFVQVTNSGSVCCSWAIPGLPQFSPLVWFIGKVEQGTPFSGEEQDCDPQPTICFNCW